MENWEMELRQCRAEVQELTQRVRELSARLDRMESPKAEVVQTPAPAPVSSREIKKPEPRTYANLERAVGKNLLAVVASLLVLLGVGVFISTIYEHIPEFVKILAIFVFGAALLGVGLVLHRKNKNHFWLGVASCGMAELLVSIITAYSYFGVLNLLWTFVLVLAWIIGSFLLTRIQPTVFKVIGYIGFVISMMLGLSLLKAGDLGIYLILVGTYGVLALFFMVTNRSKVKLNTVLALLSVVSLWLFDGMPAYLPEGYDWVCSVIMLGILAVFQGGYLVGKLHRDVYPVFALLTLAVAGTQIRHLEMAVTVPLALVMAFGLWAAGSFSGGKRTVRGFYSAFAALFLTAIAFYIGNHEKALFGWYAGFTLTAHVLYFLTKKRDAAWLGLVCFLLVYWPVGTDTDAALAGVTLGALVLFALHHSPFLREDGALRTAWYVILFVIAHSLRSRIRSLLYGPDFTWETSQWIDGVFFTVMTLVNTAYLHHTLADQERILRITKKSVVVMLLQWYVFVGSMTAVDSGIWFVSLLGVVSSLTIMSYSLHYTYRTRRETRRLMVWQFLKFSLYCWAVLWLLDSASILMNISLLVIAIFAVVLGFRLDHKSVRVYGLVLSLVDVVCLVLFNIDFSDSLQLAGGIVLCGALCFVISFLYSRLSKSALAKQEGQE